MARQRRRYRATLASMTAAALLVSPVAHAHSSPGNHLPALVLEPDPPRDSTPNPDAPTPRDAEPRRGSTPNPAAPTPRDAEPRRDSAPVPSAPPHSNSPDAPIFDREFDLEQALQGARALRERGQPGTAAEHLGAALAHLDADQLLREPDQRALLLLERAAALDAAFDADQDIEHLQQARVSLQLLLDETEIHGYAAALVDAAAAGRDRIDERIAAALTPAQGTDSSGSTHARRDPQRRGRGWRIAGWTGVGLGVAASSVAWVGLGMSARATTEVMGTARPSDELRRIDAIERGRMGNRLAAAGAIGAGTLLVCGVTALVIGVVLRRRVTQSRPTATAGPGGRPPRAAR